MRPREVISYQPNPAQMMEEEGHRSLKPAASQTLNLNFPVRRQKKQTGACSNRGSADLEEVSVIHVKSEQVILT